MDSKSKRFLMLLATVAVAGWIALNWLLGPPGYSSDYLAGHHAQHELYVEAIKSDGYKHYMQRPHLVDLEQFPHLQHQVTLVENYEASEAFQAEQHRLHLYKLFFEFFNAGLVVVLVVRFGKKPILGFLDGQIEEIRDKITQASRSRKSAQSRRAAIEDKLAHIHDEELRINASTESRLEREMAELAEANHYSLGLHQRELAERKKAENHAAEQAIKRQIVSVAIEDLIEKARANQSPESHDKLVRQFLADVEAKS